MPGSQQRYAHERVLPDVQRSAQGLREAQHELPRPIGRRIAPRHRAARLGVGPGRRVEDLLKLLERLHRTYLDRGELVRAARVAFWLGFRLSSLGEHGRAGGWSGAGSLVAEHGRPCVEVRYPATGRAALPRAATAGALTATARAVELGGQFGSGIRRPRPASRPHPARGRGGEAGALDQAMVPAPAASSLRP